MKKPSVLSSLFVLMFSLSAFAQNNPAAQIPGKMGRGGKGKTATKTDLTMEAGPGRIVGQCLMQGGIGSMPGTPCVDFVLILKDQMGKEVVRTRTNSNGVFYFEATDNTPYTIESGSRFAEITSPQGNVTTTQRVNVVAQQKN